MASNCQTTRVLMVVRPAQGGMKRHVETLCNELPRHQVKIGIAAPAGFQLDIPDAPEISPLPLRGRPHLLADSRAAHRLARLASGYDLVHAHGLRAAWISSLACSKTGRPFLFTAHNIAPRTSGITRMLLRMTANRAKGIIAVSNAVAASLARNGVEESRITVIPNGIDLSPFDVPIDRDQVRSELGLPSGTIMIAAAGRLAPEKGFDILIKAAVIVTANWPNTRFVLAGDGKEHSVLSALINQQGLSGSFFLLGHRADIASLFAASDIVVVPSLSEGQGLVALEAMAAGKPVVASKVGGLAETVVENETGLLVLPANPVALANSLEPLISDSALRDRMGEVGRTIVEREYSSHRMAAKTAELYRSLI